ncbi:MAG: trehalose-binding protein, partial [Desulfovibrionaceae bacterium]|nr:trehalose-binding protein [Desulfovibrionaceae bacterium]
VRDCNIFALVVFDKYNGEGCRVWLDPEKLKRFPTSYEWFFKLKKKKEQDGDALRAELLEHGAEMLSIRPVRMHAEALGHKSKGPVAVCPVCGEAYAANFGERCPLCAGGRDYDLL